MRDPSAVGVVSRPSLPAAEARDLAAERWGIEGNASPLPSERDQNFLIETVQGRYVLKAANVAEPRAVLDMQNRAMERLVEAGLPCPSPVPDRAGRDIAVHHGYQFRMVGYLKGRPLAEVHPRSPQLLRDLGATMGAVDRALDGFEHPAASRDLYWDVRHAERVIGERLEFIDRPGGRDLVARTLDRFTTSVRPAIGDLRRAVIHNDANDHNVLVDQRARRMTGLLDFGDMVQTVVANEVAVAAAYAILGETEPVDAARAVVGGYRSVAPLDPGDLAILMDLIRTRLATSVSVAAHQHALRPDDPYLTVSEDKAWILLERLDAIDPRTARAAFL